MPTSTGELRESLIDCIERVKGKQMEPAAALAISKLAGQVNTSLQIELKAKAEGSINADVATGALPIGETSSQA